VEEFCLLGRTRPNLYGKIPFSAREIKNTNDLLLEMKEHVQNYQVLIHSMAVSDYTPVYMTGLAEVEASSNLEEFLNKHNHQAKISSNDEVQILFLKKHMNFYKKTMA